MANLEEFIPALKYGANFGTESITAGAISGTTGTYSSTLGVTGVATFTAAPVFSAAPSGASTLRTVTDSALVGATVVLTAAQNGQTFNNRSTSASPSWTLPTASNGLWYSFTVSDVTTGFTITGGTMKFKTTAVGSTLSGTTLTNTQATAVVNDFITFVCDGTVWRAVAQSGIFAAS